MDASINVVSNETILRAFGFFNLPENWEIIEINDLLSPDRGISVGVMYPGDHDPSGIPLIKVTDMKNNRINRSPDFRISRKKHEEYIRTEFQGGELLITLVGEVGKCAIVPQDMKGFNAARAIGVLRFKDRENISFIRWCLLCKPLQELMVAWSNTTVQTTLNLKEIKRLPIPWPSKRERDTISRILGSLDDKIELNRQMNETLEAMARAIFQSWFVDFDPVRAKAEGRDTGLPSEIAALFPCEFDEVDGREVPKGWGVKPLSDSFNIKMGQSPPGTTYNENGDGIPFFQGRTDFGFRYPSVRVYCTAPTRFAEERDTLVSVRAPVGDINLTQEKCCIGRGVAAVRHKTGSRSFTYYQMRSFKDIFALFESEGTVFGSIAKTDFNSIECITPPDEIVKKFEEIVFPIDQMIENNEQQSRTLAKIRDALLPKLMSGELRVDNNSS